MCVCVCFRWWHVPTLPSLTWQKLCPASSPSNLLWWMVKLHFSSMFVFPVLVFICRLFHSVCKAQKTGTVQFNVWATETRYCCCVFLIYGCIHLFKKHLSSITHHRAPFIFSQCCTFLQFWLIHLHTHLDLSPLLCYTYLNLFTHNVPPSLRSFPSPDESDYQTDYEEDALESALSDMEMYNRYGEPTEGEETADTVQISGYKTGHFRVSSKQPFYFSYPGQTTEWISYFGHFYLEHIVPFLKCGLWQSQSGFWILYRNTWSVYTVTLIN